MKQDRCKSNILWHLHCPFCAFVNLRFVKFLLNMDLWSFGTNFSQKKTGVTCFEEVMVNNVIPEIFHLSNYWCYWNILFFINLVQFYLKNVALVIPLNIFRSAISYKNRNLSTWKTKIWTWYVFCIIVNIYFMIYMDLDW